MICNNKRWRWLAFIKITWIPNVKKIITETEIPRLAGGERDAAGASLYQFNTNYYWQTKNFLFNIETQPVWSLVNTIYLIKI